MNGLSQIWHTARRDLRVARWSIAAFVSLLVVAVASVADRERLPVDSWVLAVTIVLAGMLAMTLVIQEHSPSASGASWRVLPLSRTAVFASKVLVLAGICAMAALAEWVALLQFSMPPGESAARTLPTVAVFAAWLTIGMLVAAHTRTLRGFAGTLILAPLVLLLLTFSLGDLLARVTGSWTPSQSDMYAAYLPTMSAAFVLVALMYTHAVPPWASRTVGGLLGSVLFFTATTVSLASTASITLNESLTTRADVGAAVDTIRPAITVSLATTRSDSGDLWLDIVAGASTPDQRARTVFDEGDLVLTFGDHSEHRTTLSNERIERIERGERADGVQTLSSVDTAVATIGTVPQGIGHSSVSTSYEVGLASANDSLALRIAARLGIIVSEPAVIPTTSIAWPNARVRWIRVRVSGLSAEQRTAVERGDALAHIAGRGRLIEPQLAIRMSSPPIASERTAPHVATRAGLRMVLTDTVLQSPRDVAGVRRARILSLTMLDGAYTPLQPALGIGDPLGMGVLLMMDSASGLSELVRGGVHNGASGTLVLPGLGYSYGRYLLPASDDGRLYRTRRQAAFGPSTEVAMISWDADGDARIVSRPTPIAVSGAK